jgi:transposase
MMGERQVRQEALFYGFSLEEHVPADHLLRAIDRFVELGDIRRQLEPFYSAIGRPSVDPELMIRMLLIGYCCAIRSERRLCEEVHLNLAYRWFCRLGLDGRVPDHSTFSKNRTAASATATCCAGCSRRRCAAAWPRGSSAARASWWTPA